jgi:hypothetical protein
MSHEIYIDIIDANEGTILCKADPSFTVQELLSDLSSQQIIPSPSEVFLLNEKGILCAPFSECYEYVIESKLVLLLFHKSGVSLDFSVPSSNPQDFINELSVDWETERFDFAACPQLRGSVLEEIEGRLSFLTNQALELHGNYSAAEDFIKKAKGLVECRVSASKALINSSRVYHDAVYARFEQTVREIKEYMALFGVKQARFSESINKVDLKLAGLTTGKVNAFANQTRKKLEGLEYSLMRLKIKIFDGVLDDIFKQEESFERLENSANQAIVAYENCGNYDWSGEFLENLSVYPMFKKYKDKLILFTTKNYHTPSNLTESLTSPKIIEKIDKFNRSFDKLTGYLKVIKGFEDNLRKKIDSCRKFYKMYVTAAVSSVYKLRYAKDKLNRIDCHFAQIKEHSKILDLAEGWKQNLMKV